MILLFDLLTPDTGLMFWTIVIFGLLLLILWKFAWKPITDTLKSREEYIEKAINEAKSARDEMSNLKNENEKILRDAKIERDALIRQAKETGDQIIEQARIEAREEGKRILTEAKESIEKEKSIAFSELKDEIADIVIDLSSRIIKKELSGIQEHKELIEKNLKEL